MDTYKELNKVANHMVLNLLFHTVVQKSTLEVIKNNPVPDFDTQAKHLGWFMNTYLFSDVAISYMYNYIKTQLNKEEK